jgi:gag-polypeptide of LTR copia-type/Zinc knuckle
MASMGETSVKLILFSGKKSNWDTWSFAFESHGVIHGYMSILSGEEAAPTVKEFKAIRPDTTDDNEKAKLCLYCLNSLAFSHLVTSMDISKDLTKVAVNLLRACKSTNYPNGDAHAAFKALNGYYNVKSVASAQMLLSKYHAMELKTNQDPAVFIANMQSMRAKIEEADPSQAIGDQAFILRIINKLSAQYDSVHDILEKDIDAGVWPTISEVLEKLTIRYQHLQAHLNDNGGEKTKADTVLFAGSFKGNCRNCGKRGHKSQDCRAPGGGAYGRGSCGNGGNANHGGRGNGGVQHVQNQITNGTSFANANVVCNYCKESGHMKYSCPKLAAKNGNGTNTNKDKANVAKSDQEKEISLVMVDRYTKFSACGQCGEIGFHGEMCKECYLGMHTEPVTKKRLADADIGQCPNCCDIGFGMLGTECVACEDTGMTYDSVDTESLYPMDNDEDEEEIKVDVSVPTIFPVGLECEWTEEIVTVMNLNYAEVINRMTELMQLEAHHTSYMIKLFLRSVGGYFYSSKSKEWIEQNFVHKYVFSMVALDVKKVLHLIGSVTMINKLLLDKGWTTFTDKMLMYICAIGTSCE